jgi:hypothetical protein
MTTTPGMIYPTQKGMLSGNPRDSAIAQMEQMNSKQASLSASVGGKKKHRKHRRTKKRYGGSTIAVPQYQMLYSSQGGPGTDPNAQIQTNLQVSTQGSANAVYDNYATQKGGYIYRKRKHQKSTRRMTSHSRRASSRRFSS